MRFNTSIDDDEVRVLTDEPNSYSFVRLDDETVQDDTGHPEEVCQYIRDETEYDLADADVTFVCLEHGEDAESIRMGVSHTYTSGTEQDWGKCLV